MYIKKKIRKFQEGDPTINESPLKSVGTHVSAVPSPNPFYTAYSALLKIVMRAALSPPVGPGQKSPGRGLTGEAPGSSWILEIL
jgi:hypothetical protein